MIVTPLVKAFAIVGLYLAITADSSAQVNSWRQHYTPSYYYSYHPSYQHPSYYYQQNPQYTQPVATPTPAPAPRSTVTTKITPAPRVASAATGRWMTEFDAAWQLARKEGKPLVVIFTHHGCPECERMDGTLALPGAANALDSAVKVRVEFTENPATVQRFNVSLTPTFLVLSPAHDGEVYREVGALSLERLHQLKPSIDSLVTGPAPAAPRQQSSATRLNREEKEMPDASNSDDETSRTVASL